MIPFLENIFTEMKRKKLLNHPNPINLNVNGVTSWFNQSTKTHLFWYGQDFTGLAYHEFMDGMANITPYYNGVVLDGVELYGWTKLYKPKTEEEVIKYLYANALEIHQACSAVQIADGVYGSFEDYIVRLRRVFHWIRYFNSTQVV